MATAFAPSAARFERLIPDPEHLSKLRCAVARVHKATILATELLNLHIRRVLGDDPSADVRLLFSSNWLLNAYNEVTTGKRTVKVVPELRTTHDAHMPPFAPPDRSGVTQTQCLLYAARGIVATAETNIWMHFRARVAGLCSRRGGVRGPDSGPAPCLECS